MNLVLMLLQILSTYTIPKIVILSAKFITFLISFILAFKIKRLSPYILNYLFFVALLGWSIYIGTDLVLYEIAPISSGFFSFANLLRDVGMLAVSITPLSFVHAGYVIKEGEEIALIEKRKRIVFSVLLNFVIVIGMILNDSIQVYRKGTREPIPLPPTEPFSVNFDSVSLQGQIAFFFYMSYIAWYVFGVFQVFFVQKRESKEGKRFTRFIMIGMILIPAGFVYFVLIGFTVLPSDIRTILQVMGQVMWMLSPVLVYIGMNSKKER